MSDALDDLSVSILRTLCEAPINEGVSLPKMGKRLGTSGSVLLRALHAMSAASFGGIVGPGWVRVEEKDGRWMAYLTETGLQLFKDPPGEPA